MFLDDVDHLALAQVDLMGVLPTVVSQDTVLLQVLHLVRVGDDSLSSCGREGGREGAKRKGGGKGSTN